MKKKTVVGLVLGIACLVQPVGCQKRSQEPTVSGKITYKGNLLKGGIISFSREGKKYTGAIKNDGTYLLGIPLPGDYQVAIDTKPAKTTISNPEEMAKEMKEKAASTESPATDFNIPMDPKTKFVKAQDQYVPIPEKYADPKTSGLTAKIESSEQTLDFPLQD